MTEARENYKPPEVVTVPTAIRRTRIEEEAYAQALREVEEEDRAAAAAAAGTPEEQMSTTTKDAFRTVQPPGTAATVSSPYCPSPYKHQCVCGGCG